MIQRQEEQEEAWQQERLEYEAKQASLTKELTELRQAFADHKRRTEEEAQQNLRK